jgi:acyl-CoA dehydrogenase
MGRVPWSAEVFNCSAPDTGNMEVLARYGSPAQQAQWLQPLLAGAIRSAYVMTEPQVASSDATNVALRIDDDGDHLVLNGRKWWISGVMDPRCSLLLVMGRHLPDASRHQQHSTVIVPRDTPGSPSCATRRCSAATTRPAARPNCASRTCACPNPT